MSENLADLAVRPTYEQSVGSIKHSGVREILRRAQEVEDEITGQRSKDSLPPPKPTISWWALPGAGKAIARELHQG